MVAINLNHTYMKTYFKYGKDIPSTIVDPKIVSTLRSRSLINSSDDPSTSRFAVAFILVFILSAC